MTPLPARSLAIACALSLCAASAGAELSSGEVHVWETQEITLQATRDYANPYAEVECWIELEGPGFTRRVYGFWNGGRTFFGRKSQAMTRSPP